VARREWTVMSVLLAALSFAALAGALRLLAGWLQGS
jgi:hypothetical protein